MIIIIIYLFILFVSLPIFINAYQEYSRTRYNDRRVPDFNLKLRETICDELNSMSIFSYTEVNEDVNSRCG